MILPEEYRGDAIKKAHKLLKDPETDVRFVSSEGIVLRNGDIELTITRNSCSAVFLKEKIATTERFCQVAVGSARRPPERSYIELNPIVVKQS